MTRPVRESCSSSAEGGGTHFLIAVDSFKGTLSSREAGEALARGILAGGTQASASVCPVADGGEGSLDVLLAGWGGIRKSVNVHGPLGSPVEAFWGLAGEKAVVETAQASGLPLVPPGERDPLRSSTVGTGELMLEAFHSGAHCILLAAGGSATVDGGSGALSALGFSFLDRFGKVLPSGGASLTRLRSVRPPENKNLLRSRRWIAACDVVNPLLGPRGAAAVYGPQKGAAQNEVRLLEEGLTRFARVTEEITGVRLDNLPYSGAAGGLAGGLAAHLGAELVSGAAFVLEETLFPGSLQDADIVVTGEGRIDGQSPEGKLLSEVAGRAKADERPCVAVAGSLGPAWERVHELGVIRVYDSSEGRDVHLPPTASEAASRLEQTGKQIARDFRWERRI